MYNIVLDLQFSKLTVDTRWTFFQSPVKVEDALGRIFPIPSEYSIDELELLIKHRFKEGPGHEQVEAGDYELFNTKNSKQTIGSSSFMTTLLPGMHVTMAILIQKMSKTLEVCPMPRCRSQNTEAAPGGGRKWSVIAPSIPLDTSSIRLVNLFRSCECNVWFDQTSKKRKQPEAVTHEQEDNYDLDSSKLKFNSDNDCSPAKRQNSFKVRVRYCLKRPLCA